MSALDHRLLLDALDEAVLAVDGEGRVEYANASAVALLGQERPQLLQIPVSALWATQSRVLFEAAFRAVAAGTIPSTSVASDVVLGDGKTLPLDCRISRLPVTESLSDGRPVLVLTLRRPSSPLETESESPEEAMKWVVDEPPTGSSRIHPSPLDLVGRLSIDLFGAAEARFWLFEPATQTLVLRGCYDSETSQGQIRRGSRIPLAVSTSWVAETARSRQSVVLNHLHNKLDVDDEWTGNDGLASVALLPMIDGERLVGVFGFYSKSELREESLSALTPFAGIIAASLRGEDLDLDPNDQAAAELQRRRLRAILDVLPVGVLLFEGREARLTLGNPASAELTGEAVMPCSLEEFTDRFPIHHPDGRPFALEERPAFRTIIKGERVRQRALYRRRDGQDIVLEITTAPFSGPAGGAVSVFIDVTHQIRLEAELTERASQLKTLLDHLPVGVAYFDPQGVCRAANGPARRILGRTRTGIVGATAEVLFVAVPQLKDAVLRCLREGIPHAQQAVAWADPGGSAELRYLDWRFEPLPGENDQAAGLLALIDDVTVRKAAELQLRKAMQAAENNARSKTQFLSAVSHDLRTPVNALSLQAELLARLVEGHDDPSGDLGMLASEMHQAAGNLIDLVNDLLELTRFDSGALDYHPSDFALDAWLTRTLNPLRVTAQAKNLEFNCRVDRPGRIVRADPVKLARVIVNLAGNAIKFTDAGLVEITAKASPENWFVLQVRDTGPGIPEDQRERIFDEFAQLRNPERDRTKGTGLGLAICRRLVQGVGGFLSVESEIGKGSTFTAHFPPNHLVGFQTAQAGSPTPPPPRVAIPPLRPADSSDTAQAPPPVLLVEDDPYSRKSLKKLMEKSGFSVEAVESGTEALEIIRNRKPAVILLDLMLPGMDGSEVLRRVRENHTRAELPVVVLSGDVLSGRSSELVALDVDGILAKPVDYDRLLAVVSRFAQPVTALS